MYVYNILRKIKTIETRKPEKEVKVRIDVSFQYFLPLFLNLYRPFMSACLKKSVW